MKILLGYDGSPESRNALEEAKKLARAFSAEVCIFTSVEGGQHAARETYQGFEDALSLAKKAVNDAGIPCESKLSAQGLEPGEEMVQYAREIHAELIVIGIRKRSRVDKLVFGSNAQVVILEADCPVVSVK